MMRCCVTTTMWWGIRCGMWACIKGVTLSIGFNDGKVAKFFSLATFFLILMTITLQFK